MHVRVVSPPAPIVSWELLKAHLREDSDDQQEIGEAYIAAASAWLDGPAGWLGRAVGQQTLELVAGGFGCDPLPFRPVTTVNEISYFDVDGQEVVLDEDAYRLALDGRVVPAASWPAVGSRHDAVRIEFQAGYPEGDIPPPITQAVLLLVGHWYANREAVNVGNIVSALPFAVDALLSPFRVWQ